MKPLNQAERKKTFLNFLLFFTLTIIVVIIAVLSSAEVPLRDNAQLRGQVKAVEEEKAFITTFEEKMFETMTLLDSFDLADNEYLVDVRIKKNLAYMTGLVNDGNAVGTLCPRILENLRTLHAAKKQLREVDKSAEELEKKAIRIDKLEAELKDCEKRVIDILRSASN